jgi:hypothetical protein
VGHMQQQHMHHAVVASTGWCTMPPTGHICWTAAAPGLEKLCFSPAAAACAAGALRRKLPSHISLKPHFSATCMQSCDERVGSAVFRPSLLTHTVVCSSPSGRLPRSFVSWAGSLTPSALCFLLRSVAALSTHSRGVGSARLGWCVTHACWVCRGFDLVTLLLRSTMRRLRR